MIITEYFRTRADGVILNKTYSDLGVYIERDGLKYNMAIDPADSNRVYTETDEKIPERVSFPPEVNEKAREAFQQRLAKMRPSK